MTRSVFPPDGERVDTHTDLQNEFISRIAASGTDRALDWLIPLKNGAELSRPRPVILSLPSDSEPPYRIEISGSESMSDPLIILSSTAKTEVTNLKVGQKYYWRVNGAEVRSFTTENNKYRFMDIDGALNVRDIGGINIKQGLIYRGSEIDKEFHLTEKGKRTFKDELHIKTQLSLRREAIKYLPKPPVAEGINYVVLPYRPYLEMFEDEHRRELVTIMEFLSDESNYPIYLHCLGGADRTGMIALLLRGLMGEADEDIIVDYELTSLSSYAMGLAEGVRALGYRSRSGDYFSDFYKYFCQLGGKSIAENTEIFLRECGVEPRVIDRIRAILSN